MLLPRIATSRATGMSGGKVHRPTRRTSDINERHERNVAAFPRVYKLIVPRASNVKSKIKYFKLSLERRDVSQSKNLEKRGSCR